MNTLPLAKDIALSLFCFLGKLCARSLLSGDLLIVRRIGSKGREYIKDNRKALLCFETQKGEQDPYGVLCMKDICCAAFTDAATDDACSLLTGVITHSWRMLHRKR